jgi:hypothetical protein
MIEKERVEKTKDQMIAASFTAWQMMHSKKTFAEHLRMLGLLEKEKPVTVEQKKANVKSALAKARRILAGDRKRGKK